ncbi:hypothetical protein GCM10022419_130720 [Nonomuraea rosea]|uniref:Peptidase S8/S53 domain-containing protein n=1 Tax=Nonomuraea rosea TaxID=638574 RepID=A0ABP6ZZC3_9ACTN
MPHTLAPPPPPEDAAQRQGDRAAAPTPPSPLPPAPDDKPPARYPAQAVPGMAALHRHTLGHPDILIGVVDGLPDTGHPSLTGARLEAREPWWLPAALPDPKGAEHGTFTASVLAGQPGTVLPGLAPRCRLIALGHPVDEDAVVDPHSAARAIEELLNAGCHVIQYTMAHHTVSDDADPMLKRTIAAAVEAGVLVCAPAGNDYGKASIAPAILPGVLAVGAHRADEAMFYFSNHGPAYTGHGITTLGEAVYGATPGGGVKAQKGTCVSVALVTGTAALLVSLQHHLGQRPDPLAVRDALLATARPCSPEQAHGEPARCLNGYLDLPAAAAHLFPGLPPLTTDPPPPAPVQHSGTQHGTPSPPPPQTPPATSQAPHSTSQTPPPPPPPAQEAATKASRPAARTITLVTLADRPDLADTRPAEQQQGQREGMPAFLGHDPAGRWAHAADLQQHFPQFTFYALDNDDVVVGSGQAVPFALHAPGRDGHLPDGGWDEILLWAYTDLQGRTPPDSLGGLGIWVTPDRRGTGLPDRLLTAMKTAARSAGLTQVVIPVRPTRKHEEPHTPMSEYAARTRPDGLPADPWLRTHVRAGGIVAGIAPASMLVAGSLTQWREWTGLPFDVDGPVIVPGALTPVQASLAHDHAVYAEPNIWVRHSVDQAAPSASPATAPPT